MRLSDMTTSRPGSDLTGPFSDPALPVFHPLLYGWLLVFRRPTDSRM